MKETYSFIYRQNIETYLKNWWTDIQIKVYSVNWKMETGKSVDFGIRFLTLNVTPMLFKLYALGVDFLQPSLNSWKVLLHLINTQYAYSSSVDSNLIKYVQIHSFKVNAYFQFFNNLRISFIAYRRGPCG